MKVAVQGKTRHFGGYRQPDRNHPDWRRMAALIPPGVVPAAANLRDRMPPILDQGSLGTCVTHGVTEISAYLEGQNLADRFFSRLFIYAMTRQKEGVPLSEDSGLIIRDAIEMVATTGVPYEDLWPYDDGPVKFTEIPPQNVVDAAAAHKAQFYYRVPSLDALKASIAQGFPVVFGMSVPNNMMSDTCAQTGYIQFPAVNEGFQGGHCMVFAAYDDASGRLSGPNSWSTSWGDKGWFSLDYKWISSGYIDDMWTIRRFAL